MPPIPRVLAVLAGSAALLVLCLSGPATAAAWVLPLAGPAQVTRPFDPPSTPFGSGHRGVDLGGEPGQPVLAAGPGTVSFAAPLAGRGVLTVSHEDGLRTTYEPVTATVTVGMAVRPGEQLGLLDPGHAGCPVSACLHWGLRSGEDYLDPMSLLGGPVRLLPTGADPRPPAVRSTDRGTDGAVTSGDPPGGAATGAGAVGVLAAVATLTLRRRGSGAVAPGGRSPPGTSPA